MQGVGIRTFTKDRRFASMGGWEDFLERWEAAKTVDEAVGLLHAGPSVDTHIMKGRETPGGVAMERVDFYLHWANQREPNPESDQVAVVAQQVIVKGLLSSRAILVREETIPAHRKLLAFLREPRPALRKPPYPRFAGEYILRMLEAWAKPKAQGVDVFAALHHDTEEVLWPVLSWGYGWVLSEGHDRAEEVIDVINRFLAHHGYHVEKFMRRGPDDFERIDDLSHNNSNIRCCNRAAWALLQLMYQHLGGFLVRPGQEKVSVPA